MHEYSIVQSLVGLVERSAAEHGAVAVRRLHLRLGELSGVERPLLETAYETFRERTVCRDAELEIHPVPARWACPRCERAVGSGGSLRCSRCRLPARLAQGDEIVLQRIEMEVA
jgi:hydrogenase nickel incorporation protein HypA/HybF